MPSAQILQRLRIAWYRRQWSCARVEGAPRLLSPALLAGAGSIAFEGEVTLGWEQGPSFFSGYTYIEARRPESRVRLGAGTHLNNAVTLVSEGPGVVLGQRCLLGPGVHVYDSDFHALEAELRVSGEPGRAPVTIGDDVFLGTNAIVLKGVEIGRGSIVAAAAVVVDDVAPGTIVAGNPAREVRG
jgi:maltose O-acetyltransferase